MELVVALLLFTLSVLVAAGMLGLAAGILARSSRDLIVHEATSDLVDSLVLYGTEGTGERVVPEGRLRWSVDRSEGLTRIRAWVLPIGAGVHGTLQVETVTDDSLRILGSPPPAAAGDSGG